jgi:hypothetical protein
MRSLWTHIACTSWTSPSCSPLSSSSMKCEFTYTTRHGQDTTASLATMTVMTLHMIEFLFF